MRTKQQLAEEWEDKFHADFTYIPGCKEGFLAGFEARDQEVSALKKALEIAKSAIKHTNEFCLCYRNTYGFDYGETHPHMGKPGAGKRWLTPTDLSEPALKQIESLMKEAKCSESRDL